MILSAPHSIAATQTAWLLGTAAWLARFFVKPRPRIVRTPLDIALWAFFGWSVITSIFSYAPEYSIDKLRNALLFLIFYFVAGNLRNVRAVKFLAFALIFSCMASVVWAPIQRIYGRGVEIYGVTPESVLARGVHFDHDTYLGAKGRNLRALDTFGAQKTIPLVDGDTIVEVEGRRIRTPNELVAEIEKNETTYLEFFRQPEYFTIKVRRADLQTGGGALEKLGIKKWKHNRNWRYSGFYSQIITYAEVLQMIASLVLGLFIALDRRRSKTGALLALCLAGMMFAFLLTFTRAAQAAFLASAAAMVLVYGNRKMLLTLAAIGLPLVLIGVFFLQQTREVAVYNQADKSANYRQTVYREGFDLWTRDARNFLLGIGMDSTKRFAKEWRLFDDGKLPMSHFHSTPLQLLVERGLPALALWLWILWIYGQMLLKSSRFKVQSLKSEVQDYETEDQRPKTEDRISNPKSEIRNLKSSDWQIQGILLGCFGALVGFVVSSLVNYSLGDGEVAAVFYILMGIGVSLVMQNQKLKMQN
ncbi:MAG: O-antigen ligase family protein [Acidobacteriota bacterium]|nr:O-antigen ligase family protein [Acidobacteriota bacterium]